MLFPWHGAPFLIWVQTPVLQFIEVLALDVLLYPSETRSFSWKKGLNLCEWYIMIWWYVLCFLFNVFWNDILMDPYHRHDFAVIFPTLPRQENKIFSSCWQKTFSQVDIAHLNTTHFDKVKMSYGSLESGPLRVMRDYNSTYRCYNPSYPCITRLKKGS